MRVRSRLENSCDQVIKKAEVFPSLMNMGLAAKFKPAHGLSRKILYKSFNRFQPMVPFLNRTCDKADRNLYL